MSRGSAACVAALTTALSLCASCDSPPTPLPPPGIAWAPVEPVQGHLFVVGVDAPSGSGVISAAGEVGGEALHFRRVGPVLESLAAVPITTVDTLDGWVRADYADGRSRTDSLRIPVRAGEYEHERLTVAPRFGSPPNEEDRARLASDREKAARASREAHAMPRMWSTVRIPRESRVTSGFGTGREFNGQITSRHMGLDLAGARGAIVTAAAEGVVVIVDGFLLGGNVVYLNHGGGLLTGYFHLSEQLVSVGDTVTAGTPIGRIGSTGRVTGPHLHWVVRYGGTSVDPRSLLALPGIRSIPE
ncbi:M23 family metallopeptidase [Candidatus Palauibacter polyketidifaciens]|uniref:M23 family metallopeptidase n=1 Tax=Candidatus Palauibacter polyketidifaciens TaxID=3056740 RepID=UPI002398BBA0|nr:M23 family metallopeptidase [Candidatus Palauibacter polyketidifaciens]MDE2719512.1 M23 family metallopeptidase [Candidatus Palauibacter polyketidifaciens]